MTNSQMNYHPFLESCDIRHMFLSRHSVASKATDMKKLGTILATADLKIPGYESSGVRGLQSGSDPNERR